MSNVSFEVPAEDIQRAQAFYTRVFGWSMTNLPELDYTLMTEFSANDDPDHKNGSIVGGMTPRSELVKAPVPIIGVTSVEEALNRMRDAGGKQLTPKEQVGEFGFSCYIEDSEGNVLCLWEDV